MRSPQLLVFAALALLHGTIRAQEPEDKSPWYWQFGPGFAGRLDSSGFTQDISFEKGFTLSTLIGRRTDWLDSDRVSLGFELEGVYAEHDISKDGLLNAGSSTLKDTTVLAVLVNGIFEWRMAQDVHFYAGGGIGYAAAITADNFGDGPPGVSGDPNAFSLEDNDALAWQGKLGLRYDLGGDTNFSWLLGFRYLQTDDVRLTDRNLGRSFDYETQVAAVELALRWGI